MFDSKNVLYILTMLEAIEKNFIYSADFENEEKFYFANKQLNFNASVNLLIAIGEENKKMDEEFRFILCREILKVASHDPFSFWHTQNCPRYNKISLYKYFFQ